MAGKTTVSNAAGFAREAIERILQDRGWSEAEAAREWSIAQATLNGILADRNGTSMATLDAICAAEGWTPFDFFAQHPSTGDDVGEHALTNALMDIDPRVIERIGKRVSRLMHLGLAGQTADLVDELTKLMEAVARRAQSSG